jgi:hypothetical protein
MDPDVRVSRNRLSDPFHDRLTGAARRIFSNNKLDEDAGPAHKSKSPAIREEYQWHPKILSQG